MQNTVDDTIYISLDLGSNSFRLLAAKVIQTPYGAQISPIMQNRQNVGLASYLDKNSNINSDGIYKATQAFTNFHHIIYSTMQYYQKRVFVVATSTFRIAKNIQQLLDIFTAIMHVEIQTISGEEEARLIYLGTSYSAPYTEMQRLVVDIGGGSAEIIIGQHHQILNCRSIGIGCINVSKRFFETGYTNHNFISAINYASSLFAGIAHMFQVSNQQIIGSSGTARVLANIAHQLDNTQHPYVLSQKGLYNVKNYFIKCQNPEKLKLKKVNIQRASILAGGLAIMQSIFDNFNIHTMHICEGGLRFGVIYDELNKQHELIDDQNDIKNDIKTQYASVYALYQKLNPINLNDNYSYLEKEGLRLFQQMQSFQIYPQYIENIEKDLQIDMLKWVLYLHKIGQIIHSDDAHKHAYYIVQNTYLAGFSIEQQQNLAYLLLLQKGSLNKADQIFIYNYYPTILIIRLCLLLLKHDCLYAFDAIPSQKITKNITAVMQHMLSIKNVSIKYKPQHKISDHEQILTSTESTLIKIDVSINIANLKLIHPNLYLALINEQKIWSKVNILLIMHF
jgi:exopolyphosphatase / guanosine-5'-triphosphate,3'-diphosphate pyrophosphatase